MGKIAFVFSGQGAQHSGMGKEFYEHFDCVRALFDAAEIQRAGTLQQCFDSDAETLKQTQNTQPCLYLTDIAAAMALQESGIVPDGLAGFSLGEIPALAFGGAYTPEDGFAIACKRGNAMAKAAAAQPASMVAVLKLEKSVVEALCANHDGVYAVNDNAPGQVVCAGLLDALPAFQTDVKAAGGRALPLAVGGGFHSPMMASAAEEFGAAIANVQIDAPKLPVISNTYAKPYDDAVKATMQAQIHNPVRWVDTIRFLYAEGYDTFIECGVGNTLVKLIAKIVPEAKAYAVEDMASLQMTVAAVQEARA